MNVISLFSVLVAIGVILFVIETIVPMDQTIKRIIHVLTCLGVLYYLLKVFGLIYGPHIYLR